MKNFFLDRYDDLDDIYDEDGLLNLMLDYPAEDYDDGVDDPDYVVTGCDSSEYELFEDLPF